MEKARGGGGPQLVVANLLRLSGHGEHDDGFYVPDTLKHSDVGRDCMDIGEEQVVQEGFATAEEVASWKEESAVAVQAAPVAQFGSEVLQRNVLGRHPGSKLHGVSYRVRRFERGQDTFEQIQ